MSRHRSAIGIIVQMERAAIRAQRQAERDAAARVSALDRAEREAARANRLREKEEARRHVELEVAVSERMTAELDADVKRLETILAGGLGRSPAIDLDTLKRAPNLPPFAPGELAVAAPEPALSAFLPPAPSGLAKLLPFVRAKYEAGVAAAKERHAAAYADYQRRERERQGRLADARAKHEHVVADMRQQAAQQHAEVDALKADLTAGAPDAIRSYLSLVLEASPYPADFPQQFRVAFAAESKQVVVEYDLPSLDTVPEAGGYKYVKARDEIQAAPRPAGQRKALYLSVLAQVTIRTLHEVFQSTSPQQVESAVFNGHVEAVDQGTGRTVRPCVVTVRATREVFQELKLGRVDPIACLRTLNASVSRSPSELAPVRPVVEFSMVDPRFIEKDQVLAGLDQRPNLMELSPGEFENLISELFEKMGLETRLTQASRDGGVDCVAYDQRPILGGKVVIQAKRYRHTVGVSAVRDLFGTVQNEGASKGILVTTSGYGRAAFDFANGKPLELLDGHNLLYLLEEHAGIKARIEFPAGWQDPAADA